MNDFILRFLVSNVLLCLLLGILLLIKRAFARILTSRMQYMLWLIFLCLLAVPFLPVRFASVFHILHWLPGLFHPSSGTVASGPTADGTAPSAVSEQIYDLTLSLSPETVSTAGYLLAALWITGMTVMLFLALRSAWKLRRLQKLALPLENKEVRRLYDSCLKNLRITKNIPILTTAYLSSPVIVGCFRPRIYLPLRLISDFHPADMRYMLLHELQHYRHKDAFFNGAMQLSCIAYWFNPFVWYAAKEMKNDREIACDTAVLDTLLPEEYTAYGSTLLSLSEKISRMPFSFGTGISQNMPQTKRRILHIVSYQKPTRKKRRISAAVFLATALLLGIFAPAVSTYAGNEKSYAWNISSAHVTETDFSAYFDDCEGCFVLYDPFDENWLVYNRRQAVQRVSPDSTYKIYAAIAGLEENVITPDDSLLPWNHQVYPIRQWNEDQTLSSAMKSSVNWYFNDINQRLGASTINRYIRAIGYGNEDLSGDFPSFWMESSLKISAVEQAEVLARLYRNDFGFAPENIRAVKDSLRLSVSGSRTLYGKTGTGRIDGEDVNGWFVGWVENSGHPLFFAVNLSADSGATGHRASEIALAILSDPELAKYENN